ncbi:open rectifier potassium channel protein 1-like [Hydractinia symbiolongicarpus]|uniref:open rectifier potassium channel protein 1-like n=1 Tax=Hydractinia symbiolongicarpus TaxID=13093 RepID=UPI002551228B|nr:open rectifier potassium channel protein 1-like [Hydractinia symbiolongicarpus]
MTSNCNISIVKKHYREKVKKYLKKTLLLHVGVQIYTLLGSTLFLYLEECIGKNYERTQSKVQDICIEFNNTRQAWVNSSLLQKIEDICDKEKQPLGKTCEFSQKLIYKWWQYTFTVCSTIGYGNVAPLTDIGKFLTIAYAIPGIAIAVTAYAYVGRLINVLTQFSIVYVQLKICGKARVTRLLLKVLLFQTIITVVVILLFASMVSLKQTENLRYIDAVYFAFISFTTIGFGDFNYDFGKYIDKLHLIIPINLLFIVGLGLVVSLVTTATAVFMNDKEEEEELFRS